MNDTRAYLAGRERWLMLATIGAVSILAALIDASRFYVGAPLLMGESITWTSAFSMNAPSWLMLGVLAPLALAMASWFPIGRISQLRAVLAHIGGAMLFATIHFCAMAAFMAYRNSDWEALPRFLGKFSTSFVINMLTYMAIVGVWHAFTFYREARARELTASQLQTSLTQSRLVALRGQLNPHFLFNTLNAISTMALKGEQENVVKTIGYLGELLRVSLDDHLAQEIPLSVELDILEHYLEIQRARFGDRLTMVYDVDAAALDGMVPSMLLQPLVENAIMHGIAAIPGPGTLTIRATRDDSTLVLDVCDSGPGMRIEAGTTKGPGSGRGIGLSNTRARLEQLYQSAQSLQFSTNPGGGTRATVTIPFRQTEDREARVA
jgi:signal transduction histidine kinase